VVAPQADVVAPQADVDAQIAVMAAARITFAAARVHTVVLKPAHKTASRSQPMFPTQTLKNQFQRESE